MSNTHAFDVRPFFNTLRPHPSLQSFPWSTAIAYLALAVLAVYYVLRYLDYPIHLMSGLAWDSLVYLTPSRLISILDPGAGKTSDDTSEGDSRGSGFMAPAKKSEAMKRILGLHGEGIVSRLQHSKGISSIGTMLHAAPNSASSKKPPGLGNWDNSCYQNSVIQGLASLPALRDFLSKTSNPQESPSTKEALSNIIAELNNPSNAGKLFWAPTQLKSMSSWQQQDAQEYLSKVLDEVEKETSKVAKSWSRRGGLSEVVSLTLDPAASMHESKAWTSRFVSRHHPLGVPRFGQLPDELASVLTRNPLEGLLAQRVGCLQCGFVEGLSLIPFTCLTVPLGKQWMYDVRTCLDDYTALEHISGVECAKCTLLRNKTQIERLLSGSYDQDQGENSPLTPRLTEALQVSVKERLSAVDQALNDNDFSDNTLFKKCQISIKNRVSTTKSRQAIIARTPKSLVIHINRSVFDENSGLQRKNLADVRFPQQLDLAPWCLGNQSSSKNESVRIEGWSVDPSKSMLPPETDDIDLESGAMYDLRAVITHYGRHENGHYICYRKHWLPSQPGIGLTTKEAAESWWRLSDEEVSEVSVENVLAQGGVFMLFYEKIESPPVKNDTTPLSEDHSGTEVEEKVETIQKEPRVDEADNIVNSPLNNEDILDLVPAVGELSLPVIMEESLEAKPSPPLNPLEGSSIPEAESPPEPFLSASRSSHITPKPVTSSAESKPTIVIPLSLSTPSMLPVPSTKLTLHNTTSATASSLPSSSPNVPISKLPTTNTAEITSNSDSKPEPQKPLASPLMRTAGPRGSVSRANQAMGSVGSMVEAN
ncbi:hypothetical protein MMC29_005154 [Sticta canariensis]|nr:hypothetical protein [Sticta canariensis]